MSKFMQPIVKINLHHLHFPCAAGIGVTYWLIFYPGILTPDSVQQYGQAITGLYNDWHPPFMAFVLSAIIKSGGDLGLVTLLQFVAGFYGVLRLSMAVSRLVDVKASTSWPSLAALTVLSLPVTPLPIFLATLGKDTWSLIAMIWILALLLELGDTQSQWTHYQLASRIVVLDFLIVLLILVRHNSIAIYPLVAWCVFLVLRSRLPLRIAGFAALLPLLIYSAFNLYQYGVMKTSRAHIERIVYEIDLVSMISLDPSLRSALPYTGSRLQGELEGKFAIGDHAYAYIYLNDLIDQADYLDEQNGKTLANEYLFAVTNFPLKWMTVKTLMYFDMLHPAKARPYFQDYMQKNEFGISFADYPAVIRNGLFGVERAISSHWLARWISFVHLPWLLMNILAAILSFRQYFMGGANAGFLTVGLVLLIPLVYYLSFWLAVTASDFRFLYPATVGTQIICITGMFACLNPRISKQKSISHAG